MAKTAAVAKKTAKKVSAKVPKVPKLQKAPKKSIPKKDAPASTTVRLKPGPKPKPADELVLKRTVSMQPRTFEGLVKKGGGKLSVGIEVAFQESLKVTPVPQDVPMPKKATRLHTLKASVKATKAAKVKKSAKGAGR